MKSATRRIIPASAGVIIILVMGLVLAILTVPYAIGAPDVPTFSVMDTSGAAVQYATVYAIPAADVAELAGQPITLQSTGNYSAAALAVDEPLEDLINGNYTPAGGGVATYQYGVTNAEGIAEIADLPTGATDMFFIYVKPAAGDSAHLPGGSLTRVAVSGASLDNTLTNIEVSTKPSAAATFVGSSSCLGCHNGTVASDKSGVKQTAHKNGFMVPRSPSALQDTSKFDADDGDFNMFAALDGKFTAGDSTSGGTIVYFYAYDSTRKFDKFKTSETDPGSGVAAKVRTYKDTADGKYKMQFTNVLNSADPNNGMIKTVELTYGGGVYKQRYLTVGGSSIHMLPLQYNSRGNESAPERTRKVWRDYHLDWWVNNANTATQTFKSQPANNNAADIQCAGCHFNGYSVIKDGAGVFSSSGVADPNGETHPVTGDHQELNIGCETCHGPGSEHVAQGPGKAIVTPQNLPPERESNICSQCHSRPQGNDSFLIKKDEPLNTSNKMMVAGTSRADFLAQNTSRHDASPSGGDLWADGLHSKSHHQQYTDFIQTSMYRNGSQLETCSSCHNNHGPGTDRNQLSGTSDDSLCLSCHTGVVSSDHQVTKTGYDMGARCIECHNVKTSSSGAGNNVTGTYPHGDISSHRLDVPDKTQVGAAKMPVPFTNVCGSCHYAQPDLSLSKTATYWTGMSDYNNGILSVDYSIGNAGPSYAYSGSIVGTINTNGVLTNTLMPVAPFPIAIGGSANTTVKYSVPTSVGSFHSSVYATANNGVGSSFSYPAPYSP